MKKSFAILLFLLSNCSLLSQAQETIEAKAVRYLVESLDSVVLAQNQLILVNNKAKKVPPLGYFKDRRLWHIQGVLAINCYSKEDSIRNARVLNKQYDVFFANPKVKFIKKKYVLTSRAEKDAIQILVYKRFYYCSKLYVLLVQSDPLLRVNGEVLMVFDVEGNFLKMEMAKGAN